MPILASVIANDTNGVVADLQLACKFLHLKSVEDVLAHVPNATDCPVPRFLQLASITVAHNALVAEVHACLLGSVRLDKRTGSKGLVDFLQCVPCGTVLHFLSASESHAFLSNVSFTPVVAFLQSVLATSVHVASTAEFHPFFVTVESATDN